MTLRTISCMCVLLALIGLYCASASPPDKTTTPPQKKTTTSPKAVADGRQAVMSLYRFLMKDAAPTIEQEAKIFDLSECSLNAVRRLLLKGKQEKNAPVLLELFKKNRKLFVGTEENIRLERIRISAPFRFTQNAAGTQAGVGTQGTYIIAVSTINRKSAPSLIHSVVFCISSGRIDADDIYFGGFSGKTAMDYFHEPDWEKYKKEQENRTKNVSKREGR